MVWNDVSLMCYPETLPEEEKVQYYIKIQLDESSEVDKNSGVDRNFEKLVDKSSVVVQNTGLKLEELDEKAAVDQRVFSYHKCGCNDLTYVDMQLSQ